MSASDTIEIDSVRHAWSTLVDLRTFAETCRDKSPKGTPAFDHFSGRVTAYDSAIGVLEGLLHG